MAETQARLETILVVEDDEAVRYLAKLALESSGFQVLTAANGPDAVVACGQFAGPLHLLVADVVMPVMNGRDLAEKLETSYPGLKVLYISGYNDQVLREQRVIPEEVNFLRKPFIPSALIAKVKEVLGKK
jgi:CheY-like chemotaxis protein